MNKQNITCPLLKKQIAWGITIGAVPCERIITTNDACIHGDELLGYNPVGWIEDETFLSPPDIISHKKYQNIPYCKKCLSKNNLTEFERDTDGLMVFVALTTDCNLSCRMCNPIQSKNLEKEYYEFEKNGLAQKVREITESYFSNDYKITITDQQYEWIIDNLDKIKGFSVTGGEPLFTKKYLDLLKKFVSAGYAKDVNLRIYTNGTLFNKNTISLLNQFKNVYYYISIDGTYDVYEFIRNNSNFLRLEKSLNYLFKNNTNAREIHFVMTINSINVNNIFDFQSWAKQYPNVELNFVEVYPNHRGIGLQTLPIKILQKLKDNTDYGLLHTIFQRSIDNNKENKQKLIDELTLFDTLRNQNYRNVMHKSILDWIDE